MLTVVPTGWGVWHHEQSADKTVARLLRRQLPRSVRLPYGSSELAREDGARVQHRRDRALLALRARRSHRQFHDSQRRPAHRSADHELLCVAGVHRAQLGGGHRPTRRGRSQCQPAQFGDPNATAPPCGKPTRTATEVMLPGGARPKRGMIRLPRRLVARTAPRLPSPNKPGTRVLAMTSAFGDLTSTRRTQASRTMAGRPERQSHLVRNQAESGRVQHHRRQPVLQR